MIHGGDRSAKERVALEAVIRHASKPHGVVRRANAILLLDMGWSYAEVSGFFCLDDDTVPTWLKRYPAGGLEETTRRFISSMRHTRNTSPIRPMAG